MAQVTSSLADVDRPSARALLLLALIVALAAVFRFVGLDYAPAGGHGDVAWIGINALDWTDRGIWPFYVRELYAPEPFVVYLTGLLLPLTGVSYLAPRLVTAFLGLGFVALLFPAAWWLLDGSPRPFRERAALLASLAGAVSLHAASLSRLGMESPPFLAAVTLLVWLTAWAWRRGGWRRWALAGAALALAQYVYLPARLLPVVLALWIAHGWWADRDRLRAQGRGWIVMALVAFALSLPAIVLFLSTPEAFSARADFGTAATGGWIWRYDLSAQGGLIAVLLQKIGLILLAFGIRWDGPYTLLGQPMLGPIFFVGLLVAAGMLIRWPKRIAYAWPFLAIPVLLITDLISGTVVEAHALHQMGVLPFVFILAGMGLARLWDALDARLTSLDGWRVLAAGLLVAAILPTFVLFYRYLGEYIPAQYADPESSWRLAQADVDLARRLSAEPDRAYLLPYEEYSRSAVAWSVSGAFRQRFSAIDADGVLHLPDLPEEMTVVVPADPDRLRHDGYPSRFDSRLWVLLYDGQTLLLPPLSADPLQIPGLVGPATREELLDRSGTPIAALFTGPTPRALFEPRPVVDYPLDAIFDGGIRLLGYTLPSQELTPGEVVFVTLFWQANQPPAEDAEIFVQVWNDAGESVAGAHDFPYGGMYRPRIWRTDEVVATHHWLRLPDDLPAGRYTLVTGLYRLLQNERVPASGADVDEAITAVRAPDLRHPLPPPDEPGTPPAAPLEFGELFRAAALDISLDGAALPLGERWEAAPGQTITVEVTWEALDRPPLDYSVFLHLANRDDAPPAAQADQSMGGGGYPSGVWRAGDLVVDRLALVVPADLAPGDYPLWLGVYDWQSGDRLDAILGGESQPGGRVRLGTAVIAEP